MDCNYEVYKEEGNNLEFQGIIGSNKSIKEVAYDTFKEIKKKGYPLSSCDNYQSEKKNLAGIAIRVRGSDSVLKFSIIIATKKSYNFFISTEHLAASIVKELS